MVVKDWAVEAAHEIFESIDEMDLIDAHRASTEQSIVAIIAKHCPMKPDTAYMPIPRCETCACYVEQRPPNKAYGGAFCTMLNIGHMTPDFGCVRWVGRRACEVG